MLNSFFSFYLSVSLSLSLILPLSFSYSLMGNISLTTSNHLAFFIFYFCNSCFSSFFSCSSSSSSVQLFYCFALLSSSSSSLLVCVVTAKDLPTSHTPNGSQAYANSVGLGPILHVGNGMEIFYIWEWNLNFFRYIKHINSQYRGITI